LYRFIFAILFTALSGISSLATVPPRSKKPPVLRESHQANQKKQDPQEQAKRQARKQFALEVVKTAVAIPQSDPQDRLRVLNSAANVAGSIAPRLARKFAREGTRIEADLITRGEKPAVSLLASGHADCASAASFVENIPNAAVSSAEQSLLGAISLCRPQALEPIQMKLESALEKGILAPRALLAVMEVVGATSAWSQTQFEKMFASLPRDSKDSKAEAPNFGAMFARFAPKLDKDVAKDAGMKFLEWLSQVKDSGERNLAINMATGTLKRVLGPEKYEEALRSNLVAKTVAQLEGQRGQMEQPKEEDVSVLRALQNTGTDRTDAIEKMPPSLRAREAAANGFASGKAGDRSLAQRYFDMAFSAVEEVWAHRSEHTSAPAVVQEVAEAAAQVDAVTALSRAQKLQDPPAQAIGMLAVARVVVGTQ